MTAWPGSPVVTFRGLSPIEATVRIFGETPDRKPDVLVHPARASGRIRRQGDRLKGGMRMARASSS